MASKEPVSEELLRIIEEKRQAALIIKKRKAEERLREASLQPPPAKVCKPTNPVPPKLPISKPMISLEPLHYTTYKPSKPPSSNHVPPKLPISKPINNAQWSQNNNFNSNNNAKATNNFTNIKARSNFSSSPTKPQSNPSSKQNEAIGGNIKQISTTTKLESANRISIDCEYNSELIKIFKSIDSKIYDPDKKRWSFAIADFQSIFSKMRELKHLHIKMTEESVPENSITALIEYAKKKKVPINLTDRLNADFVNELYDFQREGIITGIQCEGRIYIADDMGLGKTIQTIGLIQWFREDWPVLIICPSSLRYQWKEALLRWIDDLSEKDVFVVKNTKDIFPHVAVTLLSYDLMNRLKDRFTLDTHRNYNVIIFDESHYLKSDTAQRTMTAASIAKSSKRLILLSGTPAVSRPIELFPQLNILNRNLFPNKHNFGVRYCKAFKQNFYKGNGHVQVWNYNGSSNLDELKIILENTFMIRRMKVDVLNQMPKKDRKVVAICPEQMTEKEKDKMKALQKELLVSKKKDRQGLLFKWFHESASAKIPSVCEYITDFLEDRPEIKFICFCHHQTMMESVEQCLTKKKINHIRIDGSTPAKNRQEACDEFQTNPRFRVALLSLTACATGLNLTAASLVIFTELFWNPGVLSQAEDRAHRIGQESEVNITYLVCRYTIDEFLWPLMSKKLETLNKVGLSRDSLGSTFNPLSQDEDQSLMDEFVNILSQGDNPKLE